MAFEGIDVKVNSLVGTVVAAGLFHFKHELGELPAAVAGVALDASGIHEGDKIEAELRLGMLGEFERHDAGSAGLLQEGDKRLTDASGIAEDAAAIPFIADQLDYLGVKLVVRGAYPGIMIDDFDRRLTSAIERHGADGDDGGVALRPGEHQAIELLVLSGVVDSGDIDGAVNARPLSGMGAHKLSELDTVEQATAGGEGQKPILGTEERVVHAQALPFRLNKSGISGIAGRNHLPGEAKMALYAVLFLKIKVVLLGLLEKSAVVPGGAVVDRGGVGGAGHGAELLGILVLVDILRLVHLKQKVGGVADDVGAFIGGEEHLAGAAEPHDIAVLGLPHTVIAELIEAILQPVHADQGLRLKGG